MGSHDDRDAARSVARSLTDLVARLGPVEAEAETWLDGPEYGELRRSLEGAVMAVAEAAGEARSAAMRSRGRPRRRPDEWEPGYELKRLREERGLTQWDLAHLSGVSRPTIQRLEAGSPSSRAATREKLAGALGVETEWIWGWREWRDDEDGPVGITPSSGLWMEMTPHIEQAARKYARKYGLGAASMSELVSAGEDGFLKACESYDPGLGKLRWWLRYKATFGVLDEARRLHHNKKRMGPSVDYLEEQGFELGY